MFWLTGFAQNRDSYLAALAWQVELGADEAMAETPQNRFEEPQKQAALGKAGPARAAPPPAPAPVADAQRPLAGHGAAEAVAEARRLADGAGSLEALKAAVEGFNGCALKKGARSTVFADGNPAARVMFIGEAPGRDEDRQGKPFVGRSGQLLDRMLGAIGLDRRSDDPATAAYITNVLPWRPVDNRDPSTDEAVMMWAFLARHIELAAPEFIVALGKAPASVLTEGPIAITRARGRWVSPPRAAGRPLLLTFHPAYLLRQPAEKAKSWRDLLSLRMALNGDAPKIEG